MSVSPLLSLAGTGFVIGEELVMGLWLSHLYEKENSSMDHIRSTFKKQLPLTRHPPGHFKYMILILSS